jgi:hypothetical protein
MRSDTKVIEAAIRTYDHNMAIVAEAQRLKKRIVTYQHLDTQQKMTKQAFDEFMQQEPELQEILTKKRSVLAASRATVVQPIHNDSKSVNSDKGDSDRMSFSSDIQVTGVKAPSGGNIVKMVNSILDNTGVLTKMDGKDMWMAVIIGLD